MKRTMMSALVAASLLLLWAAPALAKPHLFR